jgi:hypothetical protein
VPFVPSSRLLAAAAVALPTTISLGTADRLETAARDYGTELGKGVAELSASAPAVEAEPEPDVVTGADFVVPSPDTADEAFISSPANRSNGNASAKKRAHSHAVVKPGHALRVSAGTVLRLARAAAVPVGRSVPARGARPPGIEVSGVTPLGIGVRDGDVLTEVAGVPVTDATEVVAIVLAVRQRHDGAISAVFYRDREPWALTVEMPY